MVVLAVWAGAGAQAQIPTDGLAVWLKADAGVTVTGTSVTRWADQSGNSRDASQTLNTLFQPALVPNAINGLPAVHFDGINDYLSFVLPVNNLSSMTICMVAANMSNQTSASPYCRNAALFWNETASWGTVYVIPFQGSVMWRFGTTQTNNWPTYTRPASIGTSYSITITRKDGTTDTLYVNRVRVQAQGGKLQRIAACINTANIGRGYQNTFYNGRVAELIIYTKALSDTERQQVEQYLIGRYFSVNQPPTAPTNPRATSGDGSVLLSWDASSGQVSSYRVYQSLTAGGPYTLATSTTALSVRVTGLTNGTRYYFVIRAYNPAGESPNSQEVSAVPESGVSLRARSWYEYE
ncbi:MAG: fibronectin type III domain-containing protein [Candidatus Sumerlaeia bacterium]|nr:fibronectin type III domain-containing protein [Candidatus Sumerlaeia bacterium]